jgi:hypothetical protein
MPGIYPPAIKPGAFELTLIPITIWRCPDPEAVLAPSGPAPDVTFAVCPRVHTFSVELTGLVLTFVVIAASELFYTSAMALVLLPFTYKASTVVVGHDPKSMTLIIQDIALVLTFLVFSHYV